MKSLMSLGLATLCLTGCSLFYDAPRADRDFGRAQVDSWSSQVAFQQPVNREVTPTGLGGIPAEEIMKVYHQSFGVEQTREDVFTLDLTGSGGSGN